MKKVLSKIICYLSLSVTILFLFQPEARPDRDIPKDNLAYPVLIKSGDQPAGSGFFYNKEDATYLITARHVLFQGTPLDITGFPLKSIPESIRHKIELITDQKNKNKIILIFHGTMSEKERDDLIKSAQYHLQPDLFKNGVNSVYRKSQKLDLNFTKATLFSYSPKNGLNEIEIDLTRLYEKEEIKYHPSMDAALIRIGIPTEQGVLNLIDGVVPKKGPGILGLEKNTYKLFSDVLVGNTVYAFGYPTSISQINPFLNIQIPLLRRGIVAGKNDSLKVIILDCPIFHGNSGGLVMEVEETSLGHKEGKAIGVLTNFVPFIGTKIDDNLWYENSGYSIAVPMDFVEELIRQQTKK
jgi:S1-C subfamily serine protease